MTDQKLYELVTIANNTGIRNVDIAQATGYSAGYVNNWSTVRVPKDYDFVINQIIRLIEKKVGSASQELERWKEKWN